MSMGRFFLIFSFCCTVSFSANIDDFKLMSEEYPPYNMTKNGKATGISVDMLKLMLEKIDSKLTIDDVKFLPWARSYNIVQKEKNTILFVMARTEQRENLFKWVGPVGGSKIALIAKKDKKIKINSIDDIKKYKIGSVKDDVAELALKEIGISNTDSISGIKAIEKSIQKLDSGRIDLFAYMFELNSWNFKGFNPENYENVYTVKQNDFYYAFNKDTDEKIIDEMQNILDQLIIEGKLREIKSVYGR